MPQSLTLSHAYPVFKTSEIEGWTVPWEVAGYREDALAAEQGGFFDLSHWGVLGLEGPDARDYLNRMSTINFKTLAAHRTSHGAFLTGKAQVVSLGWFVCEPSRFLFWVTPGQLEAGLAHIEKFHFAENFQTKNLSPELALFALWGNAATILGLAPVPLQLTHTQLGSLELDYWADDQRPGLTLVQVKRRESEVFLAQLKHKNLPLLGEHFFDYLRVRSGVPQVGREISGTEILLETGFEASVHRNKGCYPGQEVIERIFTYGQVNKKLLPVTLRVGEQNPAVPFPLAYEGKKVGELVSWVRDPLQPSLAVGLAYMHRTLWDSQTAFETPFPDLRGTIGVK